MAYVSNLAGSMAFSGNFMYVASNYYINKFNLTTLINDPRWVSIDSDYISMAVYDDYIYRTNYNKIYKININLPIVTNDVWFSVDEGSQLAYMCNDGDYMYIINETSSKTEVLQVNIPTAQIVNTFSFGSTFIASICKYGNYVYVTSEEKYISRIDLTDNSVDTEWFTLPLLDGVTKNPGGYGLAAYGDYVYTTVQANGSSNSPSVIIQIPIDATTYTVLSSSDLNFYYLSIYKGALYGNFPSGTYAFALTETLVYSQKDLNASSIDTAMGKRGTALLRPQGKKRPIGLIEMITRTTKVRHRKRIFQTTHYDCTMTFFDRLSAIKCCFVNVDGATLRGDAIATSGPYTSAKLTIKPKGNTREVTVSHI
jgi:hypothetical protein